MFAALMKFMKAKKMLPQISDTERLALEAGTVWIDGQFFSGNPDFRKMLAESYNKLTTEEQAFLDGPAEEVCRVTEHSRDYLKKQGFFGLMIPKEYGGKGFSVLLRSCVMAKISPVSNVVG